MRVLEKGSKIILFIIVLSTTAWAQSKDGNFPITPLKFQWEQRFSDSLQIKAIPAAQQYSFDKLAFFCKIEEKVAQQSNVHMRFRLGSVPYVNYLERKSYWETYIVEK